MISVSIMGHLQTHVYSMTNHGTGENYTHWYKTDVSKMKKI